MLVAYNAKNQTRQKKYIKHYVNNDISQCALVTKILQTKNFYREKFPQTMIHVVEFSTKPDPRSIRLYKYIAVDVHIDM